MLPMMAPSAIDLVQPPKLGSQSRRIGGQTKDVLPSAAEGGVDFLLPDSTTKPA
jgi:hypothetical protein